MVKQSIPSDLQNYINAMNKWVEKSVEVFRKQELERLIKEAERFTVPIKDEKKDG